MEREALLIQDCLATCFSSSGLGYFTVDIKTFKNIFFLWKITTTVLVSVKLSMEWCMSRWPWLSQRCNDCKIFSAPEIGNGGVRIINVSALALGQELRENAVAVSTFWRHMKKKKIALILNIWTTEVNVNTLVWLIRVLFIQLTQSDHVIGNGFSHVYTLIRVKIDNVCAHAPPPPRWHMTPEQKHLSKSPWPTLTAKVTLTLHGDDDHHYIVNMRSTVLYNYPFSCYLKCLSAAWLQLFIMWCNRLPRKGASSPAYCHLFWGHGPISYLIFSVVCNLGKGPNSDKTQVHIFNIAWLICM